MICLAFVSTNCDMKLYYVYSCEENDHLQMPHFPVRARAHPNYWVTARDLHVGGDLNGNLPVKKRQNFFTSLRVTLLFTGKAKFLPTTMILILTKTWIVLG